MSKAWMAAFTAHRGPSERQNPRDYRGLCVKRMKGFEPSTFAMAIREMRPETRKLARFTMLNMA
jgi:hypothetical protein